MVNISFYLLNPRGASRSQVYVSISNHSGRLRFTTGESFYIVYCNKESRKKGQELVKRNTILYAEYNRRILHIQEELLQIELDYIRSGKPYTLEAIRNTYWNRIGKVAKEKELNLKEAYREFFKANAPDWAEGSAKKHRGTLNHLLEFYEHFKLKITPREINEELWDAFRNQYLVNKKKFSNPTSNKYLSCYDIQAHYARKNTTSWIGYKVHLTETCEQDSPHLITNVATASGPIADMEMTASIHQSLKEKELLPATHVVDTAYLDTGLLESSRQDFGVDLLGPTRSDYQWQARTKEGFTAASFQLDWQKQEAVCPLGKRSVSWSPYTAPSGIETVKIKFTQKDCSTCPGRLKCTKAKRRTITVHKEEHHLALKAARERENTKAYKEEYAKRAGIEGTISQGVRAYGLRRGKYIGLAKTHLQHVLTATAINLVRIGNWLADIPWEKTRTSAFEKLMIPVKATL